MGPTKSARTFKLRRLRETHASSLPVGHLEVSRHEYVVFIGIVARHN